MIRKLLEGRVGPLSNTEFEIIAEMATSDLKFNRVSFKKCTGPSYVVEIAVSCSQAFRSCINKR